MELRGTQKFALPQAPSKTFPEECREMAKLELPLEVKRLIRERFGNIYNIGD